MRLGARMIKTGISIILALWVAIWLDLEPPTYAAIAAIAAIQPSIYKSYQSVVSNLRGSLIGAVIAVIFYYILGSNPFVIGLVVVIVMAIQLQFKTQSTITLPAVTVIAIMAGTPSGGFLFYAFKRFSLALIGVGSSFVVNLVFMPPKFETRLYNRIVQNSEEIIQSLRLLARRESSYTVLKDDIETFRDNRHDAEELYQLYKNERTYLRRRRYAKARKLVVFREMIRTNQMGLDVLKNLHRHGNEFNQSPENLQQAIQDTLEYLCDYHGRILMILSGKTRADLPSDLSENIVEQRKKLSTQFTSLYDQGGHYQQWLYLFPAVAMIFDYHEHLIQLDRRIEQLQNYHAKDANMTFDK